MLNRVILIGRLANDPELKYTPSGIAVAQFRIAVDRPLSAEARASGQEKQADFIDIVSWRQNAEFAANYLHKGRLVAVEGRLQVREYQTQDGQRRRAYEVISDNLKGLDRPRDPQAEGAEGGAAGGGGYERSAPPAGGAPTAGARGGYAAASGGSPAARTGRSTTPPQNSNFDEDFGDLSDPFAE
jgi:single-strand DNA-binding protein